MKRLFIVGMGALLVAAVAGAEAPTTQTQEYGPTHYLAYFCTLEEERWPEPQWGNCFDVPVGSASATVVVDDVSGLPVQFMYSVFDIEGTEMVYGAYACSGAQLALPAGAAVLDVWPTWGVTSMCGEEAAAPATIGTITVTFA